MYWSILLFILIYNKGWKKRGREKKKCNTFCSNCLAHTEFYALWHLFDLLNATLYSCILSTLLAYRPSNSLQGMVYGLDYGLQKILESNISKTKKKITCTYKVYVVRTKRTTKFGWKLFSTQKWNKQQIHKKVNRDKIKEKFKWDHIFQLHFHSMYPIEFLSLILVTHGVAFD